MQLFRLRYRGCLDERPTSSFLGSMPSRRRHQRMKNREPRLYSRISQGSIDPIRIPRAKILTLIRPSRMRSNRILVDSMQRNGHKGTYTANQFKASRSYLELYVPSRRSLNTASRSASAAAVSVGDCSRK
jgi:hypothetical protein